MKHRSILGIVFIVLLQATSYLHAQNGFSPTIGVGKYELTHVGVQWNYSKISSLSAYAGSNFGVNNQTLWSAGLSFDQVFQKPLNWKIKPGYSLGVLYWSQNDELYLFKNISLPIMVLLAYPITPLLTVRAEGGIIFTTVLLSDRKQNVESGFPDRIAANFCLNLIYNLNFHEK